jgi:hypothetical protein
MDEDEFDAIISRKDIIKIRELAEIARLAAGTFSASCLLTLTAKRRTQLVKKIQRQGHR